VAEAILYSITAIIVAIIIAGGINRAFYYLAQAIVVYLDARKDCIHIQEKDRDNSSTEKGGRP